jgi:Zn-dependent protease/CBS domain-containing protein
MQLTHSLKLGRIAGIEIRVHYSWLLVAVLVTWSLAAGYFPARYRSWSAEAYWGAGIAAALLFFASVLLHELAHSLVARARGSRVQSITLFIFGGVSSIRDEPASAGDEFAIAIVGPVSSLVLAGIFWAIGAAVPGRGPAHAVLTYLAFINGILAVFNLLPGFPLDGGRVLRSVLWAATRSLRRATELASYVGHTIAYLLIFWGITQAFGGALLNGMWTVFIGWFLDGAATAARRGQEQRAALHGLRVAELMETNPPVATPAMNVQEFVFLYALRRGRRALPVVEPPGPESPADTPPRLLGLVTITDVKEVPQPEWATTSVAQIMTPMPLRTVTPDTPVEEALRLLVEGSLNQVPVVRDDRLVGLLTRADVLRYLQLREELHLDSQGRSGREPSPASPSPQTQTAA